MSIRISPLTILALFAAPLASACLCLVFRIPYFAATVLFYFAPAVLLTVTAHLPWRGLNILIFAAALTIPYSIVLDWIGVATQLWDVPRTIFPIRLFGVLPLEDLFWLYGAIFLVVAAYESFHDYRKSPLVDRRLSHFVIPVYSLTFLFVTLLGSPQSVASIHSRFTYAVLGCVFFLMPLLALSRRSSISTGPFCASVAFFAYATLLFEVTAAIQQYWVFRGEYLFSPLRIAHWTVAPLEELLFVGLVGPATAITFFEAFGNGSRHGTA